MWRPLQCIVRNRQGRSRLMGGELPSGWSRSMTSSRSPALRSPLAWLAGAALIAAAAFAAWQPLAVAAEDAVVIPLPALDEKPSSGLEKAVFAGGCFWGVQGVFQHVKGVTNAVSGYSGGEKDTAHYQM